MKKRTLYILVIVWMVFMIALFALSSCKKDAEGFRIYTIKAGNIHPNRMPHVFINDHSISYFFKVNDSYSMGYTGGWNKLPGISEGHHHKNSCRLSYYCINGLKIFGMYVYANGERIEFRIDTLENGTYCCDIKHSNSLWYLTLNGETYTCQAGKKMDVGYRLYPCLRNKIEEDWIVPIKWN